MVLDADLIRQSFAALESRAQHASRYFYAHLFTEHPEVRSMFPEDMDEQRDRLLVALGHAAAHVDRPDALLPYLRRLGHDHRKFDARPEHYPVVGESLLATLRLFCGATWNAEVEKAWVTAYQTISEVMITAAGEADQRGLPRYFDAEVVRHERRGPDVAVITVLPDHPFDYQPGQYTSLTTWYLPKVWRPYSIANAPREDGTLDLHVRKVDEGLLSGVLVDRLRLGDVLRLGAPLGRMTLDQAAPGQAPSGPASSARPLLCVAGGTGWAPIKALLQELSAAPRRVDLVLGVRHPGDVYDIDDLEALAGLEHDWLDAVVTVPARRGSRPGADEALLRELGSRGGLADWDAMVCGPGAMIGAVRRQLIRQGVPRDRVCNDPFVDRRQHKRATSPADWFLTERDVSWTDIEVRPG